MSYEPIQRLVMHREGRIGYLTIENLGKHNALSSDMWGNFPHHLQQFDDPQVRHLGIGWPVLHDQRGDIELVGQPYRSNRHKSGIRAVAPVPGEHQ